MRCTRARRSRKRGRASGLFGGFAARPLCAAERAAQAAPTLRRGPETLGVLLAAGLTQINGNAAVPLALSANVSRLAVLFLDCPSSTAIPWPVASLARAGLRGMTLMKLKIVSVFVLAFGLLAGSIGLAARLPLAPPTAQEQVENKLPANPPAKEDHPRDRLDQAGDPLPAEAISRLGTIRFRHGGSADSLAFSSDGKTLVSCSPFNGMRFWDAATGKEIQRFPEQPLSPNALSPDGKLLAITINQDNPKHERIAIRDFASGRLLPDGHPATPAKLLSHPTAKCWRLSAGVRTSNCGIPRQAVVSHT